jgi:hypothetical protein
MMQEQWSKQNAHAYRLTKRNVLHMRFKIRGAV